MRGRGRKLVAIQTETHACQEQSLAVCRAGSASVTPSAQPPKSECECSARRFVAKTRWRPTFLAIVLASSNNITRARSAAVSLGGGSRPGVGLKDSVPRSGLPRVFVRALACKRLVNTVCAGPHVPGQGAGYYRLDRVAQADRVVPAHGVLPTPRALPVVYTKRQQDCDHPQTPTDDRLRTRRAHTT